MTDFVSRLLGRFETPPIRPIVPSLFEPVLAPGVEEPPLDTGIASASPPTTPMPTTETPRIVVSAEPALAGPEPSNPARAATPAVAPETAAPPPAPDGPVAADPRPGTEIRSLIEIRSHPVTTVEPPAAVPGPATGPGEMPVPPTVSGSPRDATAPGPATPPPAPVAPPRAHPVRTTVRQDPPAHPVSAPPIPVVARRAAAPEPTVLISIGRVEVTAARAAEAPKRERPATRPVLSLDDYLRDRAGGDRT